MDDTRVDKGADREGYLRFKLLELLLLLLAVVFDFVLGFGAGIFDAFGAVCGGVVLERRGDGDVGYWRLVYTFSCCRRD